LTKLMLLHCHVLVLDIAGFVRPFPERAYPAH
jgi:hypothetical protein